MINNMINKLLNQLRLEITQQIVETYFNYYDDPTMLTTAEAFRYFYTLLSTGNIVYLINSSGSLVGWLEVWYVNESTLAEINNPNILFSPLDRNVSSGSIAYVSDLFILPEFRGDFKIIRRLKQIAETINLPRQIVFTEAKRHKRLRQFKGGASYGRQK